MHHSITKMASLISLVVTLAVTTTAVGQGSGRHFAEPMSWATLRQQLNRLSLADAQWADLQEAHDTYLVEMAQLRDGPIDRWLQDHGNGAWSPGARGDQGPRLRERDRIRGQIGDLDDTLFDAMASVLGQEQQIPLERLRLRRNRDRMLFGQHLSDAVRIELADHIEPALVDDQLAGALYDWEDQRTALLKQLTQAIDAYDTAQRDAISRQMELFEQAGNDPEALQGMAETFQSEMARIMSEVDATKQGRITPVQAHAWTGTKTIADMLPLEDAHRLRAATVQALGVRIGGNPDQLLRSWDLDPANPDVAAALADYRQDMAGLMGTAAVTAIPLPDGTGTVWAGQGDPDALPPWQVRHEALAKASEPLSKRYSELVQTLEGLASADIDTHRPLAHGRVEEAISLSDLASSGSTVVMVTTAGDGTDGVISSSYSFEVEGDDLGNISAMFGGHMLGLTPLPKHLRDRLIRDMVLEAAQQDALDVALAAHQATLDDLAAAAQKANGGGPNMLSFTLGGPSEHADELAAADDAFFEAVAMLGDPAGLTPHRLARRRAIALGQEGIASFAMGMMGGGTDAMHSADPTEALETAQLDDAVVRQHLLTLGDWHEKATANAHALADAQAAQAETMPNMVLADGETEFDHTSFDHEAMQAAAQRVESAKRDLAARNKEGIDVICETLSPGDAQQVRRAWLTRAFPSVIGRGDPLARSFGSAFGCEGLTDNQRATMMQLQMDHEEAWWATSQAIIESMAGDDAPDLFSGDLAGFEAMQRAQRDLQRRLFDRREASLKRLERLREVLTPEQLDALGGLPDPAQRGGQHMFMDF